MRTVAVLSIPQQQELQGGAKVYRYRRYLSSSSKQQKYEDEISLGLKMNLNYSWIAENAHKIQENIKIRGSDADAFEVKTLYEDFLSSKRRCESMRSERKNIAKEISKMQKSSTGQSDDNKRLEMVQKAKHLKTAISQSERDLAQKELILEYKASRIPNITSPETPLNDKERLIALLNAEEERDCSLSSSSSSDHVQIGSDSLKILDFASASKVAGSSQACFLKNEAALLELALVNFTMNYISEKGFTPVLTPDVARKTIVERCGFAPKTAAVAALKDDGDKEEDGDPLENQIYQLEKSDLCLIGTSEIPLAGMMAGELVHEKELPLRYVGFSHCFRREAHGSGDERGLYRMHQFSKVEMFGFCAAQESDSLLEEIIEIQKEIFGLLELECRVLEMPASDLGATAYRKVDIEAWMPGRNAYGEISSASNCLDYQSRRLDMRYRPMESESSSSSSSSSPSSSLSSEAVSRSGKTAYIHTVNGTGCAVPRSILAILEQRLHADGSVHIPKVLVPYMGGRDRICPKSST